MVIKGLSFKILLSPGLCIRRSEALATKEWLTTLVPTVKNWANLLAKAMSGKKKRDLVKVVLNDIYDYV